MGSRSLSEAVRRMVCRIADPEDDLYGDSTRIMGGAMTVILEAAAETEIEHRTGRPLHARGTGSVPAVE
ncbi:MAG: hypothetical protein GX446_09750 [Chthonomonadales bacterium]|nr:hypothetical protein [Chthonomonadales bacterium]